ncbi:MAG: glycogen/starch/alpha-glucan phosphorylase, partial [Lachnospiraceae bacterium]|nr:glycogen/starch/alpha-glucan phosphorylase [Lachnospiraceae bacterium]
NGAVTLGTMDGANVEIVEEVGEENAFVFGMSSEEVMEHERLNDYNPMDIFSCNDELRDVMMQLINGTYSPDDPELFRGIYNSLLTNFSGRPDTYFVLKDFMSYHEASMKTQDAYRDRLTWARMSMLQTCRCGKFSSDRTVSQYIDEIWHLDKIQV